MARTIAWNARGTALLSAADRTAVENIADVRRSGGNNDRSIVLAPVAPPVVTFDGVAVYAGGERVGTLTGNPTLAAVDAEKEL